ncbi:transposase for IS2404 domain protein [Mycobacterium ulcerans str. Harvey]|uniref:Transposase for IS2404 domain protein n=1 Tax=Mycobacterium ulcerans str. Harvey TaxID=1299332 RepID=A0ABN0R9R9_MYCUL|nr:transposase for IS2404 domain protein [Mycobacterium ulcerans str. Harvey]
MWQNQHSRASPRQWPEPRSPTKAISEYLRPLSPGERSELIGSEFRVLASCQTRGPTRRVFADGFVGDRGSATAAGMRGYAGFATWAATASDDVLAQLGVRFRRPVRRPSALFCLG